MVLGRTDADLLPPEDGAVLTAIKERVLETGIGAREEVRTTIDGVPYWYDLTLEPVVDEDGAVAGVMGVSHDITARVQATEALREYAEDLRRSNEDLERFAYVSSHDLQEPLRSIVSFSQLLERRYRGQLGQDADEYIDFIVEGGNRMQTLIQDLLAYSRVNTKAQELRPTDMEDVLAATERHLGVQLREAGAVLTHGPLPMVLADPLQIEQVFANLVSNAIKFRRPDEPLRIRVGAQKTDGFWELSVKDNGIGIEKEYFDRIFVIFQRLHTKETYPGTGIGLAIVKRIVDRHGGTIRVESTPGEGTTFFFTLPDESFKGGGVTRRSTEARRPPG
jgi:light-regulated signal transduction histidine kinase (bacteriophytochrome)